MNDASSPTGGRPPSRVYAVLGMHRSGTSWLAGSLQEKGLELGEVNEQATYNPKGNRESGTLAGIHEGVLRDSGGSWRDPPPQRRIRWSPRRLQALRLFIASMNDRYDSWGFKDPRTVLLLEEWRREVPHDLRLVGIYRHPAAVARSLARREPAIEAHAAETLWKRYNSALVDAHRRSSFPLLRFDVPAERLTAGVEHVARRLGLPRVNEPSTFFDKEFRRADGTGDEHVPLRLRTTWRYLLAHTER